MFADDASTLRLASEIVLAIAKAIDAGLSEDTIATLLHEAADALLSGELEQLAEALER